MSLADKVHNARTIAVDFERDGAAYFAVFKGGADGSRWYYRRLADAYLRRAGEFPAEVAGGRSRPGGSGLVAEYVRTIERFGATPAAAEAFEAGAATWTENPATD